jgi:uncharacterized phage-associated protein
MRSPFTGGNATLRHEVSELAYRKETFKYVHLYYECDETKERFTTTELDEVNIGQIYNQYRAKYGIPFPDEIASLRKQYGLPAIKMSRILGFGDNQFRLYENGDMPSEANGKILMGIKNPLVLKTFLINSKNQFSEDEYHKMLRKVDAIPTEKDDSERKQYLFHGIRRDITNGFAPQSISKLENVILFFINRFDGVFYTMMNKLLFYADFYSYKTRGIGLTGLSYVAIQRGPVPVRWDRIYSFFDDIRPEIVHFGNGVEGTKLKADVDFNKALFSEEESGILEKVYERFSEVNASQISETSHDEEAWQQFVGKKEPVDYSMAFSLKAM